MKRNGPFQKPGARPLPASAEAAEALAIEVLGFLASDLERLERFMSLSGLGVENLREAAAEPGFLAAVLDHLASDEALLLAFAANSGRDPLLVAKARASLSPPPD
ncbi:DUF3572 domain-containing protein [Methylocapsa palsarum]|uniref:DUF3572 domain-containing protein n=1 Tax=Methylocapsa palsarum TaxID=1612308 RepID=A0A1I3WYI8_9HYPH|nr:DUF3572 domain-containing protein [Methylocapsa palsarum]SFK12460.1 Protein of unknown function [Methylocapsa palsarum]